LATTGSAGLADRLAETLRGVTVTRAVLEHPYYGGLRFMIGFASPDAESGHPADRRTGRSNWLAKLTSNRRLVLVASGMGAQLMAELCRR